MKQATMPDAEPETERARLSPPARPRIPLTFLRIVLAPAGLTVAVALGVRGSLILNEPKMARMDEALVLYGVALFGLLVFAAGGAPALRLRWGWRRQAAEFLSRHGIELLLLTVITAFAVFMRVYKLGTFPPDDALSFEEHISGGVAYRILQRERPLFYPVRYLIAVGLAVFGENTFGLRVAGIVMGILIVPTLYLLLRRLVSVPTALFATALLAGAFWPSLHYRITADAALFTFLLALCVVAGVQRRSATLFVAAGFLAGLLSYEYEAFKPVPFYVVGFLAAAGLWLLVRASVAEGWEAGRRALIAGARAAWRPAIAFVVAAGIVAAPLMVGEHLGKDLYFSSLQRQEQDRERRGTPGLLAPNWETQAKWSAQLFAPFGKDEFPRRAPLTPMTGGVTDPLCGVLLVAGVAWTLVTPLRPYRLLFAGWFLATLMGGALLLANWEPWKFVGLLAVGMVMAAFLVDDVRLALSQVSRWRPVVERAFPLVLAAVAVYSWVWNANYFFGDVITQPPMLQAYAHPQSYWYALCDYLRGQGEENFSYSFNAGNPNLGFALPRDRPQQEAVAFGDHIWVCHGLQGKALTGALEAWPLRDVPSGPLTLAYAIPAGLLEPVRSGIAWAYDGLEPSELKAGPEELYYLVGYELSEEALRGRQGLVAEYVAGGGQGDAVLRRIDRPNRLSWDVADAPQPPFTVTWRGLVFLKAPGPWSLQAASDDPVLVALDGTPPYNANGAAAANVSHLAAGWHWVEIELEKRSPGGTFALYWQGTDGASASLEEQDMFALEPTRGWLHTRTFQIEGVGEFRTQRAESDMGQAALGPLIEETRVLAQSMAAGGKTIKREQVKLLEERFVATWRLPSDAAYTLALQFEGGEAAILIDGREEKLCGVAARNTVFSCDVRKELPAGDHRVEVLLKTSSDTWAGGRATVTVEPKGASPAENIKVVPY